MKALLALSLVISAVLISGCTQQPATIGVATQGPLYGYLFTVNDKYYLVRDVGRGQTIFTEEEIKNTTQLYDISPGTAEPIATKEEARITANAWFMEMIRMEGQVVENFDLRKCVTECENSGKVLETPKTCEQVCNEDYNQSKIIYDTISLGETKEPVLAHVKPEPKNGGSVFWRTYFVANDEAIYYANVNSTGQRMGSGGNLGTWFSEDESKNLLADYLSENGISYSEISDGVYMVYWPKQSCSNGSFCAT